MGEALFCRSLCYFYLTNLFGDVPMATTTNYRVNALLPNTSSSLVYQQIVADLQTAQGLLSPSYPSSGHERPNKWVAVSLLSRVYLYQKNWAKADSLSSLVINSGAYSLSSNLNNVFLDGSTEAILQLQPVSAGINTADGITFIPATATLIPTYAISPYLLSAFENGDQRKTDWLKSNTVSGKTYYYPYKYKVRTGATITEDNMIIRLAELYLIRAEAEAQQNNIASAISDINIIRSRAGLPALSASISAAACLAAVAQERRVEFFAELGNRWLDLKRTNTADAVLGSEKNTWKSYQALYPVPPSEIIADPNLKQNPGY